MRACMRACVCVTMESWSQFITMEGVGILCWTKTHRRKKKPVDVATGRKNIFYVCAFVFSYLSMMC